MAPAIILGDVEVADAALEAAIASEAGALAAEGVAAGDVVALLFRNDVHFPVLSLAAGRLGAVVLAVNWHLAPDELAYVVRDSAARFVIGHSDLVARLSSAAIAARLHAIDPPDIVAQRYRLPPPPRTLGGVRDWARTTRTAAPWSEPSRAAPPTMLYTSGTTGRPKGVRRPAVDGEGQKRIAASMAHVFGSRPGMRTLAAAPLYHGAPNAMALSTLRTGGTLVIQPRFDAEEALALIERHRITHAFMVPTMFVRLLRLPRETRMRYDLGSLEWLVHGAAPCPADVKRAMIEWLGPRIYDYYGATELGPITRVSVPEWLARPGTLGKVVPGARIRILDAEGRTCAANEIGEIYARNDHYPDFEYQGLPDARAAVGRDGLVTCGDVGYLDADGYLFLCDRSRDMIISGGVNIYPAEIEAALALMPGVADSAVFAIPDPEFGEAICAHVQPLAGVTLAPESIAEFLRHRIAGYKVPRTIEIVSSLPREESGKIMKRKLRDRYWSAPKPT